MGGPPLPFLNDLKAESMLKPDRKPPEDFWDSTVSVDSIVTEDAAGADVSAIGSTATDKTKVEGWKEMFYLTTHFIYVGHMVKDHSDSEIGNLLVPHGLLFPISSKGSLICIIQQTG